MKPFFEKIIIPKILEKAKERPFLVEKLKIDIHQWMGKMRKAVEFLLAEDREWNAEVMGQFCHAVDQSFGETLKTADKSFTEPIVQIRLELKGLIQDELRRQKRWKNLEWRNSGEPVSREKTIQNVMVVVTAYLGEVTPEKLKKITDQNFQDWGLTRAITNNPHFKSHIDVLVAVFGEEYGISRADFQSAAPLSWISRENTLQRVKTVVQEKLNLTFPAPKTPKWQEERAMILALQQKDMNAWGLKRSYAENKWFHSFQTVLEDAFGSFYEFKKADFSADKFSWKSREEVIENVKETVAEKLGLTFPKAGTPEWHEERRKIMALDAATLEGWGLKPAFSGQKHQFSSYVAALQTALGHYQLFREDFIPMEWKTREQTIENVHRIVTQKLHLKPCEPLSPTFHRQREQIKAISANDLQAWGLGSAFGKDNKFFQSHMDLLSEVFEDYILDYGMFKYAKAKKPSNRYRVPALSKS